MLHRAYSLLTVKSADDDARLIRGIATTPATDRVDDIVEPRGAEFKLPLPLLWHHNSREPVGHVTAAKVSDAGIEIEAQFVRVADAGKLKDRLDEAWQSVKAGLVRGLSIGFKALEMQEIKGTYGVRFVKWSWLELSAVTIPANAEASIQSVKSIDATLRAASGQQSSRVYLNLAGVAASTHKGQKMPTISEHIASLEAKRAADMARIETLLQKTVEEGASIEEGAHDEITTIQREVDTIDRDLVIFKRQQTAAAYRAAPIVVPPTPGLILPPANLQPTPGFSVKAPPKPEPGIQMARYVRCVALSFKMRRDVQSLAEELYGERDPHIVDMVRAANGQMMQKAAGAAVSAMTTSNAAELIGNVGGFADFVEFLRSQTIVGKFGMGNIPALRNVPFRVALINQATGGQAWWVGEGDGKPLTRITFGRTTLEPLKVATISVATMEVLRDSSPSAERLIRDDLAAAVAERIDQTFVDPALAGVANISPASITNGAESVASTGDTADAIRLDVRALLQKFIDSKNPLTQGVWIMGSANALALASLMNPLGQPEFPSIGMTGGTFMMRPVIISDYVGDIVVLVNASDIWFADEGGISIDSSQEASLQMVDGTDEGATNNSATPVATSLVSMFQTNSVAFRAERTLNWARRRDSAVAYLTGVSWGGAVPAS